MKNTFKVVGIALMAVFVFTTATCFGQSSGSRTLNSVDDLKKYLDSQPANGVDKPIRVSMAINDPMLEKVAEVIESAGKYVSLNITGNALKNFYTYFRGCETLVGITIPNSVTNIKSRAFSNCTNLASVTIPNSVTDIEVNAFRSCTSLSSVTIPSSVTSIDGYPFLECSSLTAINVDAANKEYSSDNGILFNKNKTILIRYPEGKTGTYTIPNSVTSIEDYAFFCTNLTSITIGNGVTSIGDTAFYNCTNLTNVTFQSTISSNNFHSEAFDETGDLRAKYLANGIGTYTRPKGGSTWTKQ